jgi:predicted ArsR family transcriptional regulator
VAINHTSVMLEGLRALLRYVKPATPLRRLEVFLYVAEHEPVAMQEVAKRLGIPEGTAYEDLRALGKLDANGKAGARLLNELPAAQDNAVKLYGLSVRGRNALQSLGSNVLPELMETEDDDMLDAYFEAVRHTRG